MSLHQLNPSHEPTIDEKLLKALQQFQALLAELDTRELPEDVEIQINALVAEVNAASTAKEFKSILHKNRTKVIQMVEKKLKWAPKNYYRNMWLALGMSVFGLPIGVVFSTAADNYAFIGLGLPIGLAIGIAVGTGMDKKAEEEGRQLSWEG